jgi:hypothetical protein
MKKTGFEVALKDKKHTAEGTFAFVFKKPKDFILGPASIYE